MRWLITIAILIASLSARAAEKPTPLSAKEIADGWIMLFDGETTFGWRVDGEATVRDGALVIGGKKATTATTTGQFTTFDFMMDSTNGSGGEQTPQLRMVTSDLSPLSGSRQKRGTYSGAIKPRCGPIVIAVPAGGTVELRRLDIKPNRMTPLFNGKDLGGWKQYAGDKGRSKSKFTVTPEGWLSLKDGPGDLQTEKQFDDFVLQLECISNGKHLNSGIFFRAIPGEYQNGYEMQIQNGFKNGDRTKPTDAGTGAIYRRQAARKVVPNDLEWFSMTLVARGNHMATWVNGYQVTDFTDTRKPDDNPRNGSKSGKGAISIQGHDPTTDLSFRGIRIAEIGKKD